jgi:hypothetical protein
MQSNSLLTNIQKLFIILLPFSAFRWLPPLGEGRPLSVVISFFWAFLFFVGGGVKLDFHKTVMSMILFFIYILLSFSFTIWFGELYSAFSRIFAYSIVLSIVLLFRKTNNINSLFHLIVKVYLVLFLTVGSIQVAAQYFEPALNLNRLIRSLICVRVQGVARVNLLGTEPSLVASQFLLFFYSLHKLNMKNIKRLILAIIGLVVLLHTRSPTCYIAFILFYVILFATRYTKLFSLSLLVVIILSIIGFKLIPLLFSISLISPRRIANIISLSDVSTLIRLRYIESMLFAWVDSRGIGLGPGNYSVYWIDIFHRHSIEYMYYYGNIPYLEVASAIEGGAHQRPWSIIFGILAEFGTVGILLFGYFIFSIWRNSDKTDKSAIIPVIVLFLMAYPIVNPHAWLILMLVHLSKLSYKRMSLINSTYIQIENPKYSVNNI